MTEHTLQDLIRWKQAAEVVLSEIRVQGTPALEFIDRVVQLSAPAGEPSERITTVQLVNDALTTASDRVTPELLDFGALDDEQADALAEGYNRAMANIEPLVIELVSLLAEQRSDV